MAGAYDFYVKNSDGILIYYNIVSSEIGNRQVEVTANPSETIDREIKIPSTVTSNGKKYKVVGIGDEAFRFQKMPSAVIPSSVSYIGESAFEYCSSLTKIELPEGIEQIGARAFYGCSHLEGITLPNSVTDIGVDAFFSLNDAFGGSIKLQDPLCNNTFFAYCHLMSKSPMVVPDGIKAIASSAFGCALNTSEVILPASVDSICTYAFYCSQQNINLRINTIIVKAAVPPTCDASAFESGLYEQTTIQVSDASPSILDAYKNAEGWKNFKNIVAIKMDDTHTSADVNNDGVVNSTDVVEIYNCIVAGTSSTSADVNADGVINSTDVVEVYNYIVAGGQ